MATFEQIFQKNKYNLGQAVDKSRRWFNQQALMLSGQNITASRLIKSNPELNVSGIVPGHMYLFRYNPKHKDTLPVWDMFPLVFPFKKISNGFLGLNMHYLPVPLRIKVLDSLMEYKTTKGLTENTRIKLSWSLITGVSKLKVAEQCVHKYLNSHVASSFKKIESENWATALMLPVEHFVYKG